MQSEDSCIDRSTGHTDGKRVAHHHIAASSDDNSCKQRRIWCSHVSFNTLPLHTSRHPTVLSSPCQSTMATAHCGYSPASWSPARRVCHLQCERSNLFSAWSSSPHPFASRGKVGTASLPPAFVRLLSIASLFPQLDPGIDIAAGVCMLVNSAEVRR